MNVDLDYDADFTNSLFIVCYGKTMSLFIITNILNPVASQLDGVGAGKRSR